MKKPAFVLLLLFFPVWAQAQSKVKAAAAIWPELQLDYAVSQEGTIFFRNQYRIDTDSDFNDLSESGILGNFERIEFTAGYEHAVTPHWRGGALLRYAIENYPKTMFYGLFLRHNGSIKSLYFNKQLSFDYVTQQDQDASGRVRLLAELGKRMPLGSKFIAPAISYEALLLSALGKEYEGRLEERTIDRTRLRLHMTYEVTSQFRIAPYFMRQTDYYYALVPPVYDENNQLLEDGYTTKRNRVSPVFGLELKYTLTGTPQPASFTY